MQGAAHVTFTSPGQVTFANEGTQKKIKFVNSLTFCSDQCYWTEIECKLQM
jgi:hypothetical protein